MYILPALAMVYIHNLALLMLQKSTQSAKVRHDMFTINEFI